MSARDPHDSASFRTYLSTMPASGFISIVAANAAFLAAAILDSPWRFVVCGILANGGIRARTHARRSHGP